MKTTHFEGPKNIGSLTKPYNMILILWEALLRSRHPPLDALPNRAFRLAGLGSFELVRGSVLHGQNGPTSRLTIHPPPPSNKPNPKSTISKVPTTSFFPPKSKIQSLQKEVVPGAGHDFGLTGKSRCLHCALNTLVTFPTAVFQEVPQKRGIQHPTTAFRRVLGISDIGQSRGWGSLDFVDLSQLSVKDSPKSRLSPARLHRGQCWRYSPERKPILESGLCGGG